MNRAHLNGSAIPSVPRATPDAQQAHAVDLNHVDRATFVAQNLDLLRACVHDYGYTLDSLAAHTRMNRAYIGHVLNGDKPLRLEFEVTLPTDLLGDYRKRQAEQFGLIVVRPLTGTDAQMAFVAGALGLLAAQLPAKATAMAKAELPIAAKKAVGA